MVKILDCFIFYNELELLKVRLEELYDIVDYFILVEGTLTFTGIEKKLFFKENLDLFNKYNKKIINIVVDDFPLTNDPWIREYYQRDSISKGLNKLQLDKEDIIIISDIDEIPSYNVINNIRNKQIIIDNNVLYSLEMQLYYYTLEWTTDRKWYYPKIINYFTYLIKPLPKAIRLGDINYNSDTIKDAGWHISYYGDCNFIINKLNSFSEWQANTNDNKNPLFLNECISKGILFFNNDKLKYKKINDNNDLPLYLLKNKK